MSEGPIKRERDQWKPITVSTPDNRRVCFSIKGGSYCGRTTSVKARTLDWAEVVCWDCRAAAAADGLNVAAQAAEGAHG